MELAPAPPHSESERFLVFFLLLRETPPFALLFLREPPVSVLTLFRRTRAMVGASGEESVSDADAREASVVFVGADIVDGCGEGTGSASSLLKENEDAPLPPSAARGEDGALDGAGAGGTARVGLRLGSVFDDGF